ASGIGALLGAVYLGTRATIRGLGKVVALGSALMGAGLFGFGCSRVLPLSLLCLGGVGLGGVLTMASSNTLVQSIVEEHQRGRWMSIFTMAFTGRMPLGNLLAGGCVGREGPCTPSRLIASGADEIRLVVQLSRTTRAWKKWWRRDGREPL